jgi:flagellar basal-body rod protein FlgB
MNEAVPALFNDPTLQSLRMAINVAASRHEAIASNIANINTPNYKRVDVSNSFQEAYKNALVQLNNGENPMSMPDAVISQAANQNPPRWDGNTVSLDSEFVELTKNQADFQFAAQVIASKYAGLKAAITGRNI